LHDLRLGEASPHHFVGQSFIDAVGHRMRSGCQFIGAYPQPIRRGFGVAIGITRSNGTDEIGFSIDSRVVGLVNPVRTYFRLSDALTEVLDARIYGGMHYRNSTRIGANMGKHVSRFTTRHFFRPAEHHGNKPNK